MQRRKFIGILGGATLSWPIGALAQRTDRMRRVGLIIALAEDDPEAHPA
jgi:putative ABC transport system substrate-binding protein